MGGEWQEQTIEQSMSALIDYRGKTPRKTSSGIPLITAKIVKGGRIETPDEFIAEEDYVDWMRRGIPKCGDVVVTTEAPLGEVAQLGNARVALAQRLICLRGKAGVVDNDFLKFLMQSERVQEQLHSRATGTTVLGIKQSELRKVLLRLPPIDEQRAIAHILGTLDDKIELNRRMNETLEAIARALFKSWFVDFDPVRAKAEGRDAGLPQPLADLFPVSFEDSELGEIPMGWTIGEARDCCDRVENGGTPSRAIESYWEPGEIPWLTSGEVRQRIVTGTENFISRGGLENSSAKLWPINSTVIALYGATAGQVTLLGSEMCANQACCALIPKQSWRYYIYQDAVRRIEFLEGQARGSAQQNLSQQIVASLTSLLPDNPLIEAFDRIVDPIFARWKSNLYQSRTLTSLRDTLLPKLISGELRVKNAERMIENAGC